MAQQPVQVIVTATPNPVSAGACAQIYVEVRDLSGQRTANVDGIQLYANSYDYSVANVADFAWLRNDPATGALCVRPGAQAVNTPVVATIRGTSHAGSTMLSVQRSAAPTQVAVAVAAPATSPPPTSAPAYQPSGVGAQPVQAVAPSDPQAYVQPSAGPQSGQTSQAPQGYMPPPQPGAQPAAVAAPGVYPVAATGNAPAPAPATEEHKGLGGFVRRIGKHIKDRAGEVTDATAENLATSANRLVDTTLQTGSGLVSGTVAGVSNAAQVTVGTTGKNLLPSALKLDGSADNLSLALGSGRAELRAMRFDRATGQLTPASLDLAKRVADELRQKQAKWVIEAYVDPGPGDQELSEYRAGLVKAALIHYGVAPDALMALGYGPSKLDPQPPGDGGPPTAAHIDIAQRAE